jgi:hypothetical protein
VTRSRVFIPSTLEQLAAFRDAGEVGPAPFGAHCAEMLRSDLPGVNEEELEYAAMVAASIDSLRRIGPDGRPARVVIAADVSTYSEDGPESEVAVTSNVSWVDVASVHVDTSDAQAAVLAALQAPEDEILLERVLEHELAWFARQEVDELLAPTRRTEQ